MLSPVAISAITPDVPVVLWLQGGPGATAMLGLFYEHGPTLCSSHLTVTLSC